MQLNTPENAQETAMSPGIAHLRFRRYLIEIIFIFSSRWLLFLLYFNLFV